MLGHPSALPVGDEVYGYPPAWPAAFTPPESDLAALHRLCRDVRDAFTAEWNAALRVLAPGAAPSADAFAEHGDLLMLNYPAALHDPARTALLPPHAFLGSAVRAEPAADDVRDWLAADDRAGRLRQLRQLPVGARGRAGDGAGRAAPARPAGRGGHRFRHRPAGRLRRTG